MKRRLLGAGVFAFTEVEWLLLDRLDRHLDAHVVANDVVIKFRITSTRN